MGAHHDDALDAFRAAVGERIRRERKRQGLSQSALAHRMPEHVSSSQISRWERGWSFPELRSLAELAVALDVPIDAFFHDSPRRRKR
jgi:transcriptional regulator with XRE-family HTH domain